MDRNRLFPTWVFRLRQSLSARRAWIEITLGGVKIGSNIVALRKESVDRNVNSRLHSLPVIVALRKESVDRNDNGNPVAVSDLGRSPQGERG